MAANMFKQVNPAWLKRIITGDQLSSRKSSRAPAVRQRESWHPTRGFVPEGLVSESSIRWNLFALECPSRSAGIAASGKTSPLLSAHTPRTIPDDLGTMNHDHDPASFFLTK